MSRIGRRPIAIPAGVDIKIDGQTVTASVPITYPVQPGDTIVIKERWF